MQKMGRIAVVTFAVCLVLAITLSVAGAMLESEASARVDHTTASSATNSDDTTADDASLAASVSSGNCCRQQNCGAGCSVCCPANKEAHCSCWKQPVACPPFAPYPGPCYEYMPQCSCR